MRKRARDNNCDLTGRDVTLKYYRKDFVV